MSLRSLISTDTIIDSIALDIESDGVIDNAANGNLIGGIDPVVMNQNPMYLTNPNTTYLIEDTIALMQEEKTAHGTSKRPVLLFESIEFDNQYTRNSYSDPDTVENLVQEPAPKQVTKPIVTLSADSIDFGDIDVGAISDALSIRLSNTGDAPMIISTITVTDSFIESNDCTNFLAVGSSCMVSVQYIPTVSGTVIGSLVIDGDADHAPFNVSLKGNSIVTPLTFNDSTASGAVFHQDFDDIAAGTILSDNQVRDAFSMESKFYVKNDGTPGVMIVADPANSGRDKVFQVSWPKGSVKTTGGGAQWVTRITAGDEYYFSYDIYVPAGFNWPLSSKLPGLYGGDLGTVTGGSKGDGVHGFALRQGVVSERKEGDTEGYFHIGDGVLLANPNTSENVGVARYNYALVNKFDGDSARLVPGKWMTLQQRVKLNTATSTAGVGYKADGIYEAWIDGVKVFSENSYTYRIVDSLKIDSISFVWWYGGTADSYMAREDQAFYFDNFIVSTQPISH